MTYYGGKELARSFRTVRRNTIQIAQDVPENKYDFRAAPETRSVAQTLVHIANTTRFPQHSVVSRITDLATFDFPAFIGPIVAEESKPRSKDEIVAMLETTGEEFARFLEGLSESTLAEEVKMRAGMEPATKTRFEMLLGAKEHEMHHRAQLMVLERMLGMKPHLTRQMEARMAQAMGRQVR
jgi:uncharacterized damage-inducible protein DinB